MAEIVVERAISLTQPWASLMAIGAKKVETRAWRTHFRGWVAIHAAQKFPPECEQLCWERSFALCLAPTYPNSPRLPLGQILAVTEIVDCQPTELYVPDELERDFGDYSPGRYAIITRGARRLKMPRAARGMLSLWRLQDAITEEELA